MRSMTDLQVRLDDRATDGSNVVYVNVEPAYMDTLTDRASPADFGNPTQAEEYAAALYLAGVLARLGMAIISEQVDLEYAANGKRVPEDECRIGSMGDWLADPRRAEGWMPELQLAVHRKRARFWLEKVAVWLAAIAVADAWNPATAGEAPEASR